VEGDAIIAASANGIAAAAASTFVVGTGEHFDG